MGIDKFRRQGYFPKLNVGGLDVYSAMGLAAIQGTVYYVEGNAGLDTNDGLSWEKAFKTLAVALAASHANVAAGSSGWAARNTIYCKGDSLDEDLTKLAAKTDVIGVGSCNNIPRCRLIGTHVIASAVYMGCRFFNMEFMDDGASSNWTFSQGGVEFHNCVFRCDANGTYAITIDVPHDVKICDCQFLPDVDDNMFDTFAIKITGGAYNCQIENNVIYGDAGISIDTGVYYHCIIKNNFIYATALTIDENSDDWFIVGNRLVSAAAKGTLGNVLDYNAALAVDNILTGSDGTIHCPSESA